MITLKFFEDIIVLLWFLIENFHNQKQIFLRLPFKNTKVWRNRCHMVCRLSTTSTWRYSRMTVRRPSSRYPSTALPLIYQVKPEPILNMSWTTWTKVCLLELMKTSATFSKVPKRGNLIGLNYRDSMVSSKALKMNEDNWSFNLKVTSHNSSSFINNRPKIPIPAYGSKDMSFKVNEKELCISGETIQYSLEEKITREVPISSNILDQNQ